MSIKELENLLKLCHKYKVKSVSIEGVELELLEHLPPVSGRKKASPQPQDNKDISSQPDEFSEEDILFWSSTPIT